MRYLILALSLFVFFAPKAQSQEMKRKVYLGIRMENLTDDTKRIMGINTEGILIREVLPQSSAQKAGFKSGDVLIHINDTKIISTAALINYLSQFESGDKFTYELIREKKIKKGQSAFTSWPVEQYPSLDVVYTQTKTPSGLQRLIITKPKTTKKLPTVVFIGGIGCYSLDSPLDSTTSEIQLLNLLSRSGYLCIRVEKPGVGDNANYCKKCNEVGFMEEKDGYVEAIKTIKQRTDVDSNAIFILGHSMGGVFAPLIAQKTKVKGIIAYGTIGTNFPEYLLKTRRTIAQAYNMTFEETDGFIKDFCECTVYYFADKMSSIEAEAKKAGCGELLSVFDLRSRSYNDELYAINYGSIWKDFTGKALFAIGEFDFVGSKEDHEILTAIVNQSHPGNASMVVVPQADHGMRITTSAPQSLTAPGAYQPKVGQTILQWLNKQK